MTVALVDTGNAWTADALAQAARDAEAWLRQRGARVLATLLDNSAAFVALDQAALAAGVVHVPLPLFFTAAQMQHALQAAGVDVLIADVAAAAMLPALGWRSVALAQRTLQWAPLALPPAQLPADTAKVTFTSGTTGEPKGVCLSRAAIARVACGLVEALAPLGITRHLNALPFSVLLENIAGLEAPRLQGATVITLPLAEVGLTGSSSFDPARLHDAVQRDRAQSLILLPQMLRAWCGWLAHQGLRAPTSLKFVAVGGAAVGAPLLAAARALGIPAFEGYGLSEGASVQTLNLPGANRPGSAGRALPHARLRIAADGEIEIGGSLFLGYVGEAAPPPAWWPTGDLGELDADGFLHVRGRKKNVLVTGYGRNVSPEWVETALRCQPALAQAVVFGDGEPALAAVLWPGHDALDDAALQAAVDDANAALPDYARIGRWTRAEAPFAAASGMATSNGRPRRPEILTRHAAALQLNLPARP